MALSPLDIIKQGAKGILDKGKAFLSAPDNSTQGLIRNTITGLPNATRQVANKGVSVAKDLIAPNYGYSDAQLKTAKVSPIQAIKSVPKVGAEIITGVGDLVAAYPSQQGLYEGLAKTKIGNKLADAGQKILEFGKPKTAEEARSMQVTGFLSNFVGGTTKNLASSVAKLKNVADPALVKQELKLFGLADDVIERISPKIADSNDVREIENLVKSSLPKHVADEIARTDIPARPTVTQSGIASRDLPEIIKKEAKTQSKLNPLIDYFRTPDRVLEKLGLGDQMKNLRYAHENYLKEFQAAVNQIGEWKKAVPKESSQRLFQFLDGQDIKLTPKEQQVATEIRLYLNEWADRLGLPQEKRVSNYITRIFDDGTGVIDDDLAKIMAEKLPNGVFNPYEIARTGASGYQEDVWKALDAYTNKATRKINLDQAIRDFDVAESLPKMDWEYVKGQLDAVMFKPTALDEKTDQAITKTLSAFGEKGKAVATKLGERPTKKVLSPLRAMGYRGTLGGNIGSALKNLSQGINTVAVLGEKNAFKGYASLFNKKNAQELIDEGVLNYGFIQDRISDNSPEWLKKIDAGLFKFFEEAERVNRGAAYFGAKAKALAEGKTGREAIEYAKEIVRKTQFQFGELDTPAFLRSDIAKSFFQLQSFSVKQIEFLTEMALKDKNFAGLLRYAAYGALFVNTIGQLFNMEMKDLVPSLRLGGGLVFKPVVEGVKSIVGTKDEYGNERTPKERATDFAKTLIPFVPGGSQAKKTVEGIDAIRNGSKNKGGETTFTIPEDDRYAKAQAVLFGKYATKQGEEYIDSGFRNQPKTISSLKKEVADKLESGEFGSAEVAREYLEAETKKIRESEEKKRMELPLKEYKSALADALEAGDITVSEAQKELKRYKEQGGTDPYKNSAERVAGYAKAFTKDPAQALRALVTKEKLGLVEGDLVKLQRFFGIQFNVKGGSQEYKRNLMEKQGIPWSKSEDYALEHIVPLAAGGSNADDNLMIVDMDLHDTYTAAEIAVGEAVKQGKINRRRAAKLMMDLKVEKTISVDDVIEAIK